MATFALVAAFVLANGQPAPAEAALPDGVRAMIQAAIDGGDAKTIESIIGIARQTHAAAAGEIDAMEQGWRQQLAEAREKQRVKKEAELAEAGLFDKWKGQVEVGASRSTGRSSYFGLFGSLGFDREGLRWRHKLLARAEIQEGPDITDTERLLASWQPYYKFDERLYAYGLTQYEADKVQGYHRRYTAGAGLGYGLITSENADLDIEGGPAFRHVDPLFGPSRSSLAARGSINLRWAISPTLELKQTSALYFEEEGDSSASALTTIDAQVMGPLKVRFSYDVRYEDSIGTDSAWIDTLSRATLVYSF